MAAAASTGPAAGMGAGVVACRPPWSYTAARENAMWRPRVCALTDVVVGQEAAHNDMILHVCTGRKGMHSLLQESKRAGARWAVCYRKCRDGCEPIVGFSPDHVLEDVVVVCACV